LNRNKKIFISHITQGTLLLDFGTYEHTILYKRVKKLMFYAKRSLPEAYSANTRERLKITEYSRCTKAGIIHLRFAGRMRPTTPLHVAALRTSNLQQRRFQVGLLGRGISPSQGRYLHT
jgi:hypothetical protein